MESGGANRRVLFITWDGPGLTYLESLFLPIFTRLKPFGYAFDVLQFRWGDPRQLQRSAEICVNAGIGYRSVSIWRRPAKLGPFASAVLGGGHVRRAVRDFKSDILLPRSVLPSIATLAAGVGRLPPILFDADGIEADERVEFAGLASTSLVYRILRDTEAQMARHADAVVVRTAAAREIVIARAGPVNRDKFHIVTNGRDADVFRPFDQPQRSETRARLSMPDGSPLIVYAGSIGFRYDSERIAEFALAVRKRRADARLLVLTGSPETARSKLGAGLDELGSSATVMSADPADVPLYLAAADVGTAFIRPTFSTQAVAPIKLGEYLLCGLPIVGTAEVGDTGEMLARGLMFSDRDGAEAAADWFVDTVLPNRERYREQARELGVSKFSVERSVDEYARALEDVAKARAAR